MAHLRSMTGFGASQGEAKGYSLRLEVRSVNHRHLAVKTRLPAPLQGLEADVERAVKGHVVRGSVSVFVSLEPGADGAGVAIDAALAKRYAAELEKLRRRLGLSGTLPLETIVALPGVVGGRDGPRSRDLAGLRRPLLTLLEEALGRMVEMRAKEGAALGRSLRRDAAALSKLVERIEGRMPLAVRAHQKSLKKRVQELLQGRAGAVADADLAREIALIADRLDVSEELARLASHLEQVGATLRSEGGKGGGKGGASGSASGIGRKLDFLVQEVFREINTIGAKCSDAKVALWVVEAKTTAERLREQAQNLE